MSDQSNTPTAPPPPDPSADAVYICETLLKRMGQIEVRLTRRMIAIEKHLAALDLDSSGSTGQIQSFGKRLSDLEREVRQSAP